jgi:hypothetical protein
LSRSKEYLRISIKRRNHFYWRINVGVGKTQQLRSAQMQNPKLYLSLGGFLKKVTQMAINLHLIPSV